MPLFKVTYDRWFRDRQDNWDFTEEEEFVHAQSAEHAIRLIVAGPGKITRPAARPATADEARRYLAEPHD